MVLDLNWDQGGFLCMHGSLVWFLLILICVSGSGGKTRSFRSCTETVTLEEGFSSPPADDLFSSITCIDFISRPVVSWRRVLGVRPLPPVAGTGFSAPPPSPRDLGEGTGEAAEGGGFHHLHT